MAVLAGVLFSAQAHARSDTGATPIPPPEITSETIIYTREEALTVDPATLKFPDQAIKNKIVGDVVIACEVAAENYLSICIVIEEVPTGYDFGRISALNFLRYVQADPVNPPGSWVRYTVRWRFE